MQSNVYKEALAEAKQLREIAEQNAKNAIVEAVTPKIREFIDNQLMENSPSQKSNLLIDEEDILSEALFDDADSDIILDNDAISSLAGMMGANTSNDFILKTLSESINSLDRDQAELVLSAAKKLETTDNSLHASEINKGVSKLQESSTMASKEKVYEIDLNLLREEASQGSRKRRSSQRRSQRSHTKKKLGSVLSDLGLLKEDKIEIDLGDDVELPEDVQIVARLLADEEEEGEFSLEVGDETMDTEDVGAEVSMSAEEEFSLDEVFEVDANALVSEPMQKEALTRWSHPGVEKEMPRLDLRTSGAEKAAEKAMHSVAALKRVTSIRLNSIL